MEMDLTKDSNADLFRKVRVFIGHISLATFNKPYGESVICELERRLSSSLADRLARVEEDLVKFRAEHRAEIERNPYGDGYAKADRSADDIRHNDNSREGFWREYLINRQGRPTDREIFDSGWDARKRSEFKRASCEPDADEEAWQKLSAWNKRRFGDGALPLDVEIIGPFGGDAARISGGGKPFYYARLSDGHSAKGDTRSEALQAAAEYAENQCRPVGTGG